jgi:hypothetical protein
MELNFPASSLGAVCSHTSSPQRVTVQSYRNGLWADPVRRQEGDGLWFNFVGQCLLSRLAFLSSGGLRLLTNRSLHDVLWDCSRVFFIYIGKIMQGVHMYVWLWSVRDQGCQGTVHPTGFWGCWPESCSDPGGSVVDSLRPAGDGLPNLESTLTFPVGSPSPKCH